MGLQPDFCDLAEEGNASGTLARTSLMVEKAVPFLTSHSCSKWDVFVRFQPGYRCHLLSRNENVIIIRKYFFALKKEEGRKNKTFSLYAQRAKKKGENLSGIA